MSYKLEKKEPLSDNIKRIVSEELDAAIDSLNNQNIHEAVHEIRKRLKEIRALARLFRDEMGEDNFKTINAFFRDLGQELSPIRDLTAHMETIEALNLRYGDHVYVNFFKSLTHSLETERNQLEKKLMQEKFFSENIMQKLEYGRKELASWPVNTNDISVILPGIERVYKRGKCALTAAYRDPRKETFHEWRKRVKYLWYQILLLQDLWPGLFTTLEVEVHELADFLGDDHDLMVLNDKLLSPEFGVKDDKQKEMLHALISEYSEHLRKSAKLKGELIYAEKPKNFTKRIGKYAEVSWN
ncbi:CHAD domain-containing protein [Salegentibacter chungangensis]|uniref:CHAD domain-containing protein n=1 Tax=Salegentibacter chungangensis TaxID=1335724 RepID=A0ABW3NST6_9FLAO